MNFTHKNIKQNKQENNKIGTRLIIENLNIHNINNKNIKSLETKFKSKTMVYTMILTKRGMIKTNKDKFTLYKLKKNKNIDFKNNRLSYKKYIICDFPYEWKKIGQIDTFSNLHCEITIKKQIIESPNSSLKLVLEYYSNKINDCYFIINDEINRIIENDIRLFIDILI